MSLDTRALGMAAGGAGAVGFAVCALLVTVAPGATSAFFSYVLHLDLSSLARPLTWGSFAAGLLAIALGLAVFAALVGSIYNRLARSGTVRAAVTPDQ